MKKKLLILSLFLGFLSGCTKEKVQTQAEQYNFTGIKTFDASGNIVDAPPFVENGK